MSGALTGLGAASIAKSAGRQRMFAATPLLFAAQQATEGVVWTTLGDASHAALHRLAVRAFLAFAVVVWPSWLPLSLLLVEQQAARRQLLVALLAWGAGVSLYATWLLAHWRPAVHVAGHSLAYDYHVPSAELLHVIGYVIPTIVPLFVSTEPLAPTIGAALTVSLAATVVIQREALTSVWCFFAAALSAIILWAVSRERVTATA